MREQIKKLQDVEKTLCEEKGPFEFFALFLREDAPEKWDLIISSDWAREDKKAAMELVIEKVASVFEDSEILMLSRLIILAKDDDSGFKALNRALHVDHGLIELSDCVIFGVSIKHAYLITSQDGS